ncbi:hypothetical protein [Streptomyces sp. NPDC001450]
MDHFFVSHGKVRRFYEAPPGVDLDAAAYVQRPGAVKEGTPFFLDPGMRPAEPLCSFFLELSKSLKAKPLEDYTYDALDLVDVLGQLLVPTDLVSATEDDLVAYREDCTGHREAPDKPATWRKRRSLINNFYDWAVDARLLGQRPYFRRGSGRDVLAWGATTELDARHLTFRRWRFLKQVGLRGCLPDGLVDPAFRGRSSLRNSAAGELAITTGILSRSGGSSSRSPRPSPSRNNCHGTPPNCSPASSHPAARRTAAIAGSSPPKTSTTSSTTSTPPPTTKGWRPSPTRTSARTCSGERCP